MRRRDEPQRHDEEWRTQGDAGEQHARITGAIFGAKVNPLIKVAQGARAQALRIGVEFGLTPAARSRISTAPAPVKGEKAEEFIIGKCDPSGSREGPTPVRS